MNFGYIALLLAVTSLPSMAAEWDGCASALDDLRRAARDAHDAAEDVRSKYDAYENCRRYPDTYDLFRDQCRSASNDYQSAARQLGGELDTVRRRINYVASSCEYDLSGAAPWASNSNPSENPKNRMCEMYRGYRNTLPIASILLTCPGFSAQS